MVQIPWLKFRTIKPAIFFIAGFCLFTAQANTNIRDLTSQETADKAQSGQIPAETSSRSTSRGYSTLHNHYVGVGVGQTFLKGDMRPNGSDQLGLDLFYTYTASLSFDFVANFHTSSHKRNDNKVKNTGLALGIKGRFYQYDNFAPFVLGGFGFYQPKLKRTFGDQVISSESKIVFGNHLGLGVELKLNRKVTIGALAHLHNPFDVQQDNQPDVEGSYYKLMMTALYSF
jgi:hypothetical protein